VWSGLTSEKKHAHRGSPPSSMDTHSVRPPGCGSKPDKWPVQRVGYQAGSHIMERQASDCDGKSVILSFDTEILVASANHH